MFHVGQLVVCVERFSGHAAQPNVPARGRVYTIREVDEGEEYFTGEPDVGVWLEEVVNPVESTSNYEIGFKSGGFRPVDETKLTVFQAMLVSPPKETVTIGQD